MSFSICDHKSFGGHLSYILITGGEWGLGVRIFKNILKCRVILNLYQKSSGDRQNILIGGVFLYCMILILGFYCSR